MAQMFPTSLYDDDTRHRAEVKIYDALREQLDDSWDVFHSTSWTMRTGEQGSWDGEIDFVVSHPEHGILCIEAKGGDAKFERGKWFRREAGEYVPYTKDPFQQAVGHAHALRKLIKEMPGWRDSHVLIGHALSFPEITLNARRYPPEAPRQLLIDRHDVEGIRDAIERAFTFHAGNRHDVPGDRGMRMLRERLVPPLEIEVPMAEHFLEEEAELILLTHEQTMLLRRFGRDRRLVVSGCAGSGKTMLAVEQAKWLKREKGFDVAFVCFNKQLANWLKDRERDSGVEFWTFHGLCTKLAYEAGIELPRFPAGEEPPQDYWLTTLPEALADAAAKLGGRYDALMVDEAQDLHNDWLTALMYTLKDEKSAYVWLFMDSNQRVFEAALEVPPEFRPFDLTWNCRNTQAIHREVMKKYVGEVIPEARGPEGRPIEFHQTDDPANTIAGVIERLCGPDEVPPQDVVVVSSHGFDNSEIAHSLPGRYRLVNKRNAPGKSIFFSSIRAFKGLESKVVILCELEDLDDETRDPQLYVGMSRAINYCVLVVPVP
jgi:Nuclease-related domain/AAA domain/UvrD-like helicase C-terminal domain